MNNNKGLIVPIYWKEHLEGEAELRNFVCKADDKEFWEVQFLDKEYISCRWINKKDIKIKSNNSINDNKGVNELC